MSLKGLKILSFESRRGKEMEALIRNFGGEPWVVPSMREIPLGENPEALRLAEALSQNAVDILILLTGVGTRTLIEIFQTRYSLEAVRSFLERPVLVARGPKPVAALAEIGLRPHLTAPEPNTWREILSALEQKKIELRGKRIAVQEYGEPNNELISELKDCGAVVTRVPIYRWALPGDLAPLQEAVRAVAEGKIKITLWTNAQQAVHAFQISRQLGKESEFRKGLNQGFAASIGPTCSERLKEHGVRVAFEPSHPKMGVLVSELARVDFSGFSGKSTAL